MTNQEIKIAIAKLTGKTCRQCNGTGIMRKMSGPDFDRVCEIMEANKIPGPPNQPDIECGEWCELPNYPESLDACAEFESKMTGAEIAHYKDILVFNLKGARNAILATALDRCNARLRVEDRDLTGMLLTQKGFYQ